MQSNNIYDEAYILPVSDDGDDFMDADDLDGQRVMPSALLNYSPVSLAIDTLIALCDENTGPVRQMFANIFGYVVILEVRTDTSAHLPYLYSTAGGGGITCSCDEGGSECPYKEKKLGLVKYCDASNCKKCTMNGIIVNPDDSHHDFQVDYYGYIQVLN